MKAETSRAARLRDEVDVLELARQRRAGRAGRVQPDRQAAEDVDRQRLSSRVLEDAVA
jgi:hypothetical protein